MINSLLGDCYDQSVECSQWAHYGHCQSNPHYVLIHCPISCGVHCGIYFNLAFSASICHSPEKGATKAVKHLANDCLVCDKSVNKLSLQTNSSNCSKKKNILHSLFFSFS